MKVISLLVLCRLELHVCLGFEELHVSLEQRCRTGFRSRFCTHDDLCLSFLDTDLGLQLSPLTKKKKKVFYCLKASREACTVC